MQLAGFPGQCPGPGAGAALEHQQAFLGVDLQRLPAGQTLSVADRRGEDVGQHRPTLEFGQRRLVGPVRRRRRVERLDRRADHAGLIQRRQHVLDVTQERRVRSDDQHAAAGEPVTVGVEQVGGAVQRDHGLTGARPALDDEDPTLVRADDPILLGLNGLDDVAHPAGACGVEGGEQRRLADQLVGGAELGELEDVVVEAGHLAAPRRDVPAPTDAEARRPGRRVERPGGRGPPVDQQGLVVRVLVEDAHPADVAPLAAVEVEPAEAQAVLGGGDPGQRGRAVGAGRIPLEPGSRQALGVPENTAQPGRGAPTKPVEPIVESGDVRLLRFNVIC